MLRSIFVGFICLFALAVSSDLHAQTRLFHPGQSGLTFTRDSSSRGGREYSNDWRLRASYTHKGIFDIGAGTGRDYEGQSFSDWTKVIYGTIALVKPDSSSGFGVDLHGHYAFQKEPSHLLILLGHVDPVKVELYARTFHSELKLYSRHNPSPNTRLSWGLGAFYRFHKNQYLAPNDEVLYGNDDGQLGGAVDLHFLLYQRVHFSYRIEYAQTKDYYGKDGWAYDTLVSIGLMVGLNHGDKEPVHE